MQWKIMENSNKSEIDKIKLTKGLRKVAFAILLMFIGPVVINSAFKNEGHILYYPVLLIGIAICLTAMYQFFMGIKTMVRGIFND